MQASKRECWEDTPMWPHITAFKSQTPPVPQTQIWVLMWWNKSYWIAAEMCILSQHLTPCVRNYRGFHNELIANYHMAQKEGCSETIRPFETFRERTDMQFAVFSVSKIIWGLRSVCREKQHSVFQVQEHCHNLPVLKWKKNPHPLATRWRSNIGGISIHVGDNSYSYFCSEIN